MADKPTLGGERIKLRCANCGNELTIIDRDIADYGPVRCGACGEEVQTSQLHRVFDALAGRSAGG